jgi:DNA-binding response OmpR family regulator
MHIIVIDDEKILSAGIEKKLLQAEYEVSVLNSYTEYLQSTIQNPDLYLVDVSLGDGSGFDIVASLRGNLKTKDIPILLMS